MLQYFVLDAIVEEATFELAWIMPEKDEQGKLKLVYHSSQEKLIYWLSYGVDHDKEG
jgi:hypothetical protein